MVGSRLAWPTFVSVLMTLAAMQHQAAHGDEQEPPLEDTWTVMSIQHDGQKLPQSNLKGLRFVFKDSTLTMRIAERVLAESDYEVDRSKQPQRIRMTYAGQPTLGIYQLDGDDLKICLSGSADAQPDRFASKANTANRMLITLRRGDLVPEGWPLFALGRDGSGYRRLAPLPKELVPGSPDCSPDGSKIAFDGWNRRTDVNYVAAHIYVLDLESNELQDIAVGAMPSWSPDGRRITFCQYSPNHGVWMMNADGSEKKMIDPSGWGSDWSPVGNEIAYTVSAGGADIRIVNPDTGKDRTLLKDQEYRSIYWNPSWSPDGERICFKGVRADGTQEIAVVSTKGDGKRFRVLLSTANGKYKNVLPIVAWDGNRDRVVVSIQGPDDKCRQLYLLDPEGIDAPKRLPGQDPDGINGDMAWSADGETVIFSSRKRGSL